MTAPDRPEATNPALPIRDQLSEAQKAVEALSALDWTTYRCQCEHGHTCAAPAAYIVHIHCIDRLQQPRRRPVRQPHRNPMQHMPSRATHRRRDKAAPTKAVGAASLCWLRRADI